MSDLLVTDVKFQRRAKKTSGDNYINYSKVRNKKSFIQALRFFPWITINHLHAIFSFLFCLWCSVCRYYFPFLLLHCPLSLLLWALMSTGYSDTDGVAINSLIDWHMHLLFSCLYTVGTHSLIHLLKYTFS